MNWFGPSVWSDTSSVQESASHFQTELPSRVEWSGVESLCGFCWLSEQGSALQGPLCVLNGLEGLREPAWPGVEGWKDQ